MTWFAFCDKFSNRFTKVMLCPYTIQSVHYPCITLKCDNLHYWYSEPIDSQTVQSESNDVLPTLKVVWKSKKTDATNGGYNKEVLQEMFSKYGPLNHVLVSTKKNGKALISFQHPLDAVSVFNTTWVNVCIYVHMYIYLRVLLSYMYYSYKTLRQYVCVQHTRCSVSCMLIRSSNVIYIS